jgi:hypothetical protein
MNEMQKVFPVERVQSRILTIRGQSVILDTDLADLYGVPTKALNQAVKRNSARFPADFTFGLTGKEKQEVVTNCDHLRKLRFSPALPHAFTEHGALMAANVLNSDQAIAMSVFVVRAFLQMRGTLAQSQAFAETLLDLERKLTGRLDVHEKSILHILTHLKSLIGAGSLPPPEEKHGEIGFHVRPDSSRLIESKD